MAWQKGQSGNPSGLTVLQARTRRMVEGLGPKAVLRLEKLMASENESVALGAAKEILARVAPAPKTGTLAVDVTHNASPHLSALVTLATLTAARVHGAPEIDGQVIDNIGPMMIVDQSEHVNVDVDAPDE
jgi:hypothetical protein